MFPNERETSEKREETNWVRCTQGTPRSTRQPANAERVVSVGCSRRRGVVPKRTGGTPVPDSTMQRIPSSSAERVASHPGPRQPYSRSYTEGIPDVGQCHTCCTARQGQHTQWWKQGHSRQTAWQPIRQWRLCEDTCGDRLQQCNVHIDPKGSVRAWPGGFYRWILKSGST